MLEVPAEAAGLADVAAFGAFAWAAYLVLMAVLGVAAGTIVSLVLLAPRKPR